MSLRPNRASGAPPPNYGGYAGAGAPAAPAGGYGTPGAPGYGGTGASYYQQTPASAPYAQQSYSGNAYGGGGGYSAGGGGGSSQGSYGGYSGGTPVYTGASSSPSGSFKDKPKKKRSSSKDNSNMVALFLAALAVLFMISTLHFRGKVNQVLRQARAKSITEALEKIQIDNESLQELQREKSAFTRTERALNKRITDMEKDVQRLENDIKKEREIHSTVAKDFEFHREEVVHHTERLASREEAWSNTVEVLQAFTQRESKRQALERYVIKKEQGERIVDCDFLRR